MAYRVAYGTSVANQTRRAFDERSFTSLDAAIRAMRAIKRRGFWTWIEDDRGNFVPVPGAKRESMRKGYPLRGAKLGDIGPSTRKLTAVRDGIRGARRALDRGSCQDASALLKLTDQVVAHTPVGASEREQLADVRHAYSKKCRR